MENDEFSEKIIKIVSGILGEEDVELVESSFVRSGNNILLKFLVDRKAGGISLADCSRLNKRIGDILDQGEIMQGTYLLEVSSPGLDRPLKSKNDFLRSLNKRVKFFLKRQINGKIELDGLVCRAEEYAVIIENNSQTIRIPLPEIIKAKQIIE